MKKIFLIVCFIFSLISYSQENYTFRSGGRIFDNNNLKISPTDVRTKFSDNTKFLELYNSGRTKKTVGNILLYTGISTLVIKHLIVVTEPIQSDSRGAVTTKSSSNILYFVSGGLILASIPVKIGFSKRIRKAVELLNSNTKSADVGFFDSESVIFDSNGIGLKMTF
jgi:hypothetical protein